MSKVSLILAAVFAAVSAFALDDVTLPADGRFYDGTPSVANFTSINLSGDLYATGSVTAVGGLTGTHTNYNCAEATIGKATVQTNITVGGNAVVSGAITGASARVTGTATAADLVATNSIDTQSLVVDTTATLTGVATFAAKPVFSAAAVVAATNDATAGWAITVNGTNYVVQLYPN